MVVSQPMVKTTVRPLSPFKEADETARTLYPLTEAVGSLVETVLSQVVNSYTMEMPPSTPLHPLLPVTLTPSQLTTIPAPCNPLPQRCLPGVRPTTMSHSTGEKDDCRWRKWFEDHYGV